MTLKIDKLKDALDQEPKFRLSQAIKAIYEQGAASWDEVSVFSKEMREKLNSECPLDIEAEKYSSEDGSTVKAAIDFDGDTVESVLMRHEGRNTVCVSTQLGCALKCAFCLTGDMGFKRNLEMDEMLVQVLYFVRFLKAKGERVNNIVFMGMGEPFNNYNELIKTVYKLNDPAYFGIGARHISISTSGLVPGIKKLAKEKIQVNLAVSLHAADDKTRNKIMPINSSYPITELLSSIKYYIDKTRRRVMIEYIMLKGINDGVEHAHNLAALLKDQLAELYFVNIIKYNPTDKFEPSSKKSIDTFKRILDQSGVDVVERYRFGRDVKGACGQLSQKK